MTSPRPAPATHKLPLYIRNVSCDQWIRLSIDSSSSVAMLKDKVLDRLGIGDEEPDFHFDITRLHSNNKRGGTTRQNQSRSGLNDRSFLARAPRAVLAAQLTSGPQQSSQSLLVADTVAARRQAELILGGDPGRGGQGSMPATKISPCTQPVRHRSQQLRRAHSLGNSRTQGSPRRDLSTSQHTTAGSPLRRRLPRTTTSDESIASVLALAQAADIVLSTTPDSRVITTPSSSTDDPFQHTAYLKTRASVSSLSGAGDDERSLSRQSVLEDLSRDSTESNQLEHAQSAITDVVHASSPPPVPERQEPIAVLRGNEAAKKREEEALRRLNESLEKSNLILRKQSTASPSEPRQPPLSTSTSGSSADPNSQRRPTLMTANARRAQRQKQRAMEYLEADDALPDDIDDEAQGPEPNISVASSSAYVRPSFWIPASETASSDDEARKELSPDAASANGELEPVPVGMNVVWSRHEAHKALSPQSPASSSGTSYSLNSPSTSSSRGKQAVLETTDEQRLWGTQLEADLAKRQTQDDNADIANTAARSSISSHRRHRSGTIKAPTLQSPNLSGVLNARVSAPTLYGQRLQASPLPVKPASISSFSSLPPQEQKVNAEQVASSHAPTTPLGVHQGSAISSATSIASRAQVDTIMNQLRSSTSCHHDSEAKCTPRSRRMAAHYCLLSFSKGMTLEDSASLGSYRLRPFELLELQPLSTRHRVRLPRQHLRRGSVPRRHSGEGFSRHTSSPGHVASATSVSRPPKDTVAAWPLQDGDYLETFAHGWAYVHHPRDCPEKARAVGLGCWKLRWLVIHQGVLCVFRRRPDPAKEAMTASGRELVSEKVEERIKSSTASSQSLIAKHNLADLAWLDSELADGTTSPLMRSLAKDLINISFSSPSMHPMTIKADGSGSAQADYIVSLRFVTNHATHSWYSLFQRFLCRAQLARRGGILKLDELARLPLPSNIGVYRSLSDFLQHTDTDLPCPWDAAVKVSVDDWRKRAYLRSLVAGRGGVAQPGKAGRGGGRNAWTTARPNPTSGDVNLEDVDLWSDHSEEEGIFTVQGKPFAWTGSSAGATLPDSSAQDLEESHKSPGVTTLQQRATSMEEVLTTYITADDGPSVKKRIVRPSTQGGGSQRLFHAGTPRHKRSIDMSAADWFPPPPPPPPDSGSMDSTYKALTMRRNSFANLAAAFVGGGRLSSSHGRRPAPGKKGSPASVRPEVTRLQMPARAPSLDVAKRSHESTSPPPELSIVTRDVASASLRTPSLSAPFKVSTSVAGLTNTTRTSQCQTEEQIEVDVKRFSAVENLATKLVASESHAESCSSHSSSSLTPRPQAPMLVPVTEPRSTSLPSAASLLDIGRGSTETSAAGPSTPRGASALSPLTIQTAGARTVSAEGSSKSPVLPPRSPLRTSVSRRAVGSESRAAPAPTLDQVESEGQEPHPSVQSPPTQEAVAVAAPGAVASPLEAATAPASLPARRSTSAVSQTPATTPESATAATVTVSLQDVPSTAPAVSARPSTSQKTDTLSPPIGTSQGARLSTSTGTGTTTGTEPSLISAPSLRLEELTHQKKRARGWSLSRFISKKG